MKVTIDNFDGQGQLDYTAQLCGKTPALIERKLNRPSQCLLVLAPRPLASPVAGARVMVIADGGVLLFTGYVIAAPARVFQGMDSEGPLYVLDVSCQSDEFLLQGTVTRNTTESVAISAGELLATMMRRAGSAGLPVSGDALASEIGGFQARPGRSWAANVGALADVAHARYRALDGRLLFESIGAQVHRLSESDGSFDRSAFQGERKRAVVTDVTVCGPAEPQAYVTEIFVGDGITTAFDLSEVPFLEKGVVIEDAFSQAAIDNQVWAVSDGGSQVSTTTRGLTLGSAGTGSLIALDAVELGGSLLLELDGVQMDSPGEAYIAGLAAGSVSAGNMVAAFHLQPSGAGVTATPLVLGVPAGASVLLQSGRCYTFRVRFFCRERQRALQTYAVAGANGNVIEGGAPIDAAASLTLEVQETTGGVPFAPVVLYDGATLSAPITATPVVISSVNYVGSIARVQLTRPGDVWVTCTALGGSPVAQRLGATGQDAQAKITSAGKLTFFPGQTPAAGTIVKALYRSSGHAAARMSSGASPSLGSTVIRVEEPKTRSSTDCENAALALLSSSSWSEGAWTGKYETWNSQQTADIWPGDLLDVNAPSAAVVAPLLVRQVRIQMVPSEPKLLHYTIGYANEWMESSSVRWTEAAPADVWLPSVALTSPVSLQGTGDLSVTNVSATEIEITGQTSPPSGGGFEVRRGDGGFAPSSGGDLVLRSPAANFTIVREAPVERYFIRMYDGATPPNYSRFSSAIFVSAAMQ